MRHEEVVLHGAVREADTPSLQPGPLPGLLTGMLPNQVVLMKQFVIDKSRYAQASCLFFQHVHPNFMLVGLFSSIKLASVVCGLMGYITWPAGQSLFSASF